MSPLARSLIASILCASSVCAADPDANDLAFFEDQIRPLLHTRCGKCHSADSESVGGNLQLDTREGWLRGGDLGAAIVPGDPDNSLLIRAVKQTGDDVQMPPDGKLSETEIGRLEKWIRDGAVDPRHGSTFGKTKSPDRKAAENHWAFRPFGSTPLPELDPPYRKWATTPMDVLVAHAHQSGGLSPAARADRRTLIRRVTYDLLGMPPTPQEVAGFLSDHRPGAYERLVDRLLGSPRYGERWGRHWLDVARYADSNGLDENAAHANAWRYRDYVIGAWNTDLPFDQFMQEQLAGDLLDSPDEATARRRTIATGFLVLGPKVLAEGDEKKMELDIVDEQIETVGRAFMGLTLGCARCHDHKFDPISTKDYYALAGIFASTKTMESFKRVAKWNEVTIASHRQRAGHEKQLERIASFKAEVDQFTTEANRLLLERLADGAKLPKDPESQYDDATKSQLNLLRARVADAESQLKPLPTAMAVADMPEPADQSVLIRGSHLTPADPIRRGFPAVFASARQQRFSIPPSQSGRLQLSQWLASPDHPLLARVIVNRVWRWHFGRGIASSTDNFGLLGDPPANPALLDWLAKKLIEDDWSLKKLNRRIVLSATYQMSSRGDASNDAVDPGNRNWWRFDVRRLEAEQLLDAMHHVSGVVDFQMGGSQLQTENRVLVFNHTSEDKTTYRSTRRAVYLPIIRNHLADIFQLFDYAEASVMTSDRGSTTVAPQALFLMNSEIANRAAKAFAERLFREADTQRDRLELAYQLAYGRPPSAAETKRDIGYLDRFRANRTGEEGVHEAWLMLCQTLLVSSEFCFVR